jgi:hypothetical protein
MSTGLLADKGCNMASEVAKFIELHTGRVTPDSLVEFKKKDYKALIKACRVQMAMDMLHKLNNS